MSSSAPVDQSFQNHVNSQLLIIIILVAIILGLILFSWLIFGIALFAYRYNVPTPTWRKPRMQEEIPNY